MTEHTMTQEAAIKAVLAKIDAASACINQCVSAASGEAAIAMGQTRNALSFQRARLANHLPPEEQPDIEDDPEEGGGETED